MITLAVNMLDTIGKYVKVRKKNGEVMINSL